MKTKFVDLMNSRNPVKISKVKQRFFWTAATAATCSVWDLGLWYVWGTLT